MDANGHRFWLLAAAADFDPSPGGTVWADGCLRLAGEPRAIATTTPRSRALALAALPPVTVDGYGTWAWFDPEAGDEDEAGAIVASGAGDGPATVLGVPAGAAIGDLSVDQRGVLRIAGTVAAGQSGLTLADLRGRWRSPYFIETPGAVPDRVTEGWVLERATGRLWAEAGEPIADLAVRAYSEHIFRPRPEYANPPRLEEVAPIGIAANERIADCAARPDGLLAVLVLANPQRRAARIVFVSPAGDRRSVDIPVRGYPGSIGWVSRSRLALLYPDLPRAAVFETGTGLPESLAVAPSRYPLKSDAAHRLCRGSVLPAQVTAYRAGRPRPPRPLHPISLADYAATGRAGAAAIIDAGATGTVWHRLVVEGEFPPGTGATIHLSAADATGALDDAPAAAHHFGEVGATADDEARGGWIEEPSEVPFHPGLLGTEPVEGRSGCFIALIQQPGRVSREIPGRFLKLSVTLHGRGQATPGIAAIRVYAARFSLVRHYLPPVFHPPADPALRAEAGAAHPSDFFERFVASFEGVLTRLEDKVAAAHLLTDPHAAPEAALEWLSGWIGLTMAPGLDTSRRRAMLANAMRLHRRRGTLGGLLLALDIASGGAVGRGGIVAFEDFRLRRVFATILGASLGAEFDPLLGGEVESGNSIVGSTLHLGDADEVGDTGRPRLSAAQEAELAALFRAPTEKDTADAVRGFFARLAWRVTVLVHHQTDPDALRLIREVALQMTPAHIGLRVEQASKPLILGLYSLVGVDTYLRPRPGPGPVRLDRSLLGEKDFILRLPALDPRLEHGDRS